MCSCENLRKLSFQCCRFLREVGGMTINSVREEEEEEEELVALRARCKQSFGSVGKVNRQGK